MPPTKTAPMRAAFFRWVAGAGFEPTTFRLGACSRWRCALFSLVLVEAARTRSVPQSRGLESAALGWSAVGTIVDALSDGCLQGLSIRARDGATTAELGMIVDEVVCGLVGRSVDMGRQAASRRPLPAGRAPRAAAAAAPDQH